MKMEKKKKKSRHAYGICPWFYTPLLGSNMCFKHTCACNKFKERHFLNIPDKVCVMDTNNISLSKIVIIQSHMNTDCWWIQLLHVYLEYVHLNLWLDSLYPLRKLISMQVCDVTCTKCNQQASAAEQVLIIQPVSLEKCAASHCYMDFMLEMS